MNWTFFELGELITKARGGAYTGRGKRSGTPGHYTYEYADDKGKHGPKKREAKERELKELRKDFDDLEYEIRTVDDAKYLKGLERDLYESWNRLGEWKMEMRNYRDELKWLRSKLTVLKKRTKVAEKSLQQQKTKPRKKAKIAKPKASKPKGYGGGDRPHDKAVYPSEMDGDKSYTSWERVGGYWVVDRTSGGGHLKGDPAYTKHLEEKAGTSRPVAYFEQGVDPNKQNNPALTRKARNALQAKYRDVGLSKLPPIGATDVVDRGDTIKDLHAEAVITWRDDHGARSAYTHEYIRRNADKKWNRVRELSGKAASATKKLRSTIADKSKSTEERDAAAAVLIMLQTGLRPGHGGQERVETFGTKGVTTLTNADVTVDDKSGRVSFSFTGKMKKQNTAELKDKALASYLNVKGKRSKPIFKSKLGARELESALSDAGLSGITSKDLRTYNANRIAAKFLSKVKGPLTEKEVKKVVREASAHVAEFLNNTPAMAKKSYIAPEVFDSWRESLEIVSKAADEDILTSAFSKPARQEDDVLLVVYSDEPELEQFDLPAWALEMESKSMNFRELGGLIKKAEKPPSGYRPMKRSKHGGYVSADGKKSWYPSKAHAKKDMDHHADRLDHHTDEAKSAHHDGDHEFRQAHDKRSLHHDDMLVLASEFHKQPKEAKKKAQSFTDLLDDRSDGGGREKIESIEHTIYEIERYSPGRGDPDEYSSLRDQVDALKKESGYEFKTDHLDTKDALINEYNAITFHEKANIGKYHDRQTEIAGKFGIDYLREMDEVARGPRRDVPDIEKSLGRSSNELTLKNILFKAFPGARKSPPKGYPDERKEYADPKHYKYPLDTAEHVRAALSYFSQRENYKIYSEGQQKSMWRRMLVAAKKFDINVGKKSGPPSVEGMALEKAKYISRKRVKGKYVYTYKDDKKKPKKALYEEDDTDPSSARGASAMGIDRVFTEELEDFLKENIHHEDSYFDVNDKEYVDALKFALVWNGGGKADPKKVDEGIARGWVNEIGDFKDEFIAKYEKEGLDPKDPRVEEGISNALKSLANSDLAFVLKSPTRVKKSGPPSVEGMTLEKADPKTKVKLQKLLDEWTERDPNTLAGRYYHDLKRTVDSIAKAKYISKGGPYIGKRGGKWVDARHTIPWKEGKPKKADAKKEITNKTKGHKKMSVKKSFTALGNIIRKAKYISRKKVKGKYVYKYRDDKKPSRKEPSVDHEKHMDHHFGEHEGVDELAGLYVDEAPVKAILRRQADLHLEAGGAHEFAHNIKSDPDYTPEDRRKASEKAHKLAGMANRGFTGKKIEEFMEKQEDADSDEEVWAEVETPEGHKEHDEHQKQTIANLDKKELKRVENKLTVKNLSKDDSFEFFERLAYGSDDADHFARNMVAEFHTNAAPKFHIDRDAYIIAGAKKLYKEFADRETKRQASSRSDFKRNVQRKLLSGQPLTQKSHPTLTGLLRKAKYISRKRVGDKWVYKYAEDKKPSGTKHEGAGEVSHHNKENKRHNDQFQTVQLMINEISGSSPQDLDKIRDLDKQQEIHLAALDAHGRALATHTNPTSTQKQKRDASKTANQIGDIAGRWKNGHGEYNKRLKRAKPGSVESDTAGSMKVLRTGRRTSFK